MSKIANYIFILYYIIYTNFDVQSILRSVIVRWYFFEILSFNVQSCDVQSFYVQSFDVQSFDVQSFDIQSFDV
jgi:hypothetical protein